MPARDPELDARATDRLTLFSDAVVAIAITLLAIDLPVPAGGTTHAFLSSVWGHRYEYLAFLLSFYTIAAAWSSHHDVFQATRRVDPLLRKLDMGWLLTIVLVPFATRLLTSKGSEGLIEQALQFGFYSLLQVLKSGLLLAMLRYMTGHGLADDLPPSVARTAAKQSLELMLAFGLSIPVFFFTTWGWVVWIAVPVLNGFWSRFSKNRTSRQPGV
ncbi:MAG TPA: TMEM175 family protein [Trebonia sp.]